MATGPFRLDGKVALVTGGSQGIGKAITMALATAGATVAVTNTSAKHADAEAVCADVRAAGGNANAYDLDVTDTGRIPQVVEQVVADLGHLDILVNNAGVRSATSALDLTEQEWDTVLGVNLKGVFFCAQAAAKHMVSQGGGRIINIASQLAVTAGPSRVAYLASKGGVVAITKGLALEWPDKGITVNAVGPGPTATPMTEGGPPEREAAILARSPLSRRLQPEEIAGAVVFLASEEAAAVNGHHLLVDGGWTIS